MRKIGFYAALAVLMNYCRQTRLEPELDFIKYFPLQVGVPLEAKIIQLDSRLDFQIETIESNRSQRKKFELLCIPAFALSTSEWKNLHADDNP